MDWAKEALAKGGVGAESGGDIGEIEGAADRAVIAPGDGVAVAAAVDGGTGVGPGEVELLGGGIDVEDDGGAGGREGEEQAGGEVQQKFSRQAR